MYVENRGLLLLLRMYSFAAQKCELMFSPFVGIVWCRVVDISVCVSVAQRPVNRRPKRLTTNPSNSRLRKRLNQLPPTSTRKQMKTRPQGPSLLGFLWQVSFQSRQTQLSLQQSSFYYYINTWSSRNHRHVIL